MGDGRKELIFFVLGVDNRSTLSYIGKSKAETTTNLEGNQVMATTERFQESMGERLRERRCRWCGETLCFLEVSVCLSPCSNAPNDYIDARLAHLEAIEAAKRELDFENLQSFSPDETTPNLELKNALKKLHDIIKEGMESK